MILAIIGKIGIGGGNGHVAEYGGEAIRALSMDGRMTVCNMSIEGGALVGYVNPDQTTFDYLKDRTFTPKGEAFDRALAEFAASYADVNQRDYDAFADAVHTGRLQATEGL